jgi:ubiquitin-activating enzyme E1-like protein 2
LILVWQARPEDFEKDDDTNHHIDFITAASNIRATQYGIQSADRLKTKKVAGKIIPAMATSTAAITGLAALEILKIVKKVPLEQYKNAWMNLAIPMVAFSEPQECPVSRLAEGVTYTLWDRWEVREGDLALGQLINHFKKHYKLVISAIIQNTTLVYSTLFSDSKKKIPMKMSKLLVVPEGNDNVELTMSFQTLEGEDVQTTPPVVFYFRKN